MPSSPTYVADRYRLVRLLGYGGMGRVWLAHDEVLHRDVAVKEIIPPVGLTTTEREELRLRTLREARAAARLSHPNVVRIYDTVNIDQRPWIVMEYVPSRSLHQVVNMDGPLTPRKAAKVGLAVLSALRAAHTAGVLHRDIKPGNVLLADDKRVVLTDFGLATFDGGGESQQLTRSGLILGSPQYIAPERARDGVSLPESDLWSLGATLYAAVEGRSPYARSNAMATLTALATEEPDPAMNAGPLRPVLNALLRKDPKQRATIAQTQRLLRQALAGGPPPGRLQRLIPRPRRGGEGVSPVDRAVAGQLPAKPVPPAKPIPAMRPIRAVSPGKTASPGDAANPVGRPSPVDRVPPVPADQPRPVEDRTKLVPPIPPIPPIETAPIEPAAAAPTSAAAKPTSAAAEPTSAAAEPVPAVAARTPQPAPQSVGKPPVPPDRSPGGYQPVLAAVTAARRRWVRFARGHRRFLLVIAGALVVVLAVAGAVRASIDDPETGSSRSTGTPTPGEPTAQAGSATGGSSQPPSSASSSADSGSDTDQFSGGAGGGQLPAGWIIHQDPTGFQVAVPAAWPISREGTMVYFREPGGRVLGIDQTDTPKSDPVADWTAQEADRSWTFQNYQRVKIEAVSYFLTAADWEYRYQSGGTPVHVVDRGFVTSPTRAYAIFWLTGEDEWQSSYSLFSIICASFRPAS